MGCGASKAALVANTEVTTKALPRTAPSQVLSSEDAEELASSLASPAPMQQSRLQPLDSKHSSLGEQTSMGALRTSAGQRDEEGTRLSPNKSERSVAVADNEVVMSASTEKYAAFEVDMAHRDSLTPSVPPPRRLEKLVDAPKVTAEMLAEKQRVVKERKEMEMEKRSSSTRLSKKERLRKEIMEFRELENIQSRTSQKLVQSEDSILKIVRDPGGQYEPVEMEVDQTYNEDPQVDTWDGHSSPLDNSTFSPLLNSDSFPATQTLDTSKPNETESFDNWG